jgi:Mg2+-importing ATPase
VLLSLSIVLTACILTLPPFAQTFGFSPLPPVFFGILALIAGIYLGLVEIAKHVFYRRLKGPAIAV